MVIISKNLILYVTKKAQHKEKMNSSDVLLSSVGIGSFERCALHNDKGPAVIAPHKIEWWYEGYRHRIDGPAYIEGKIKKWFINGNLHRDDGPAVINGHTYTKLWYKNGRLHREDGPAMINEHTGEKLWAKNGMLVSGKNH